MSFRRLCGTFNSPETKFVEVDDFGDGTPTTTAVSTASSFPSLTGTSADDSSFASLARQWKAELSAVVRPVFAVPDWTTPSQERTPITAAGDTPLAVPVSATLPRPIPHSMCVSNFLTPVETAATTDAEDAVVLERHADSASAEDADTALDMWTLCTPTLHGQRVSLVRAPCYAPVASPMLIALDLDGTVLRTPLSEVPLSQCAGAEAAAAHFIDAKFFAWFCAAAHERGHLLAIASFTDGAADRHVFGASAAESVLYLLDQVLPASRLYLCSTEDIVCQPQSRRFPGKQWHLQEVQQKLNSAWHYSLLALQQHGTDAAAAANTGGRAAPAGSCEDRSPPSPSVAPALPPSPSFLAQTAPPRENVVPSWLSTDILLVDDSTFNCATADQAGYRAACCDGCGLTHDWYNQQLRLHELLDVGPCNSL